MEKGPVVLVQFYIRESSMEVRQFATFAKSEIERFRGHQIGRGKILASKLPRDMLLSTLWELWIFGEEGKRTLKEAATHQQKKSYK
jgi:hypothetical protein